MKENSIHEIYEEYETEENEDLIFYLSTTIEMHPVNREQELATIKEFLDQKASPTIGLVIGSALRLNIDIIELFLENKAQPNKILEGAGEVPLIYAIKGVLAEKYTTKIIDLLLYYGANPNVDKEKIIPKGLKSYAVNNLLLLKYLYQTPMHYATVYKKNISRNAPVRQQICKALLPAIIDPSTVIAYNQQFPKEPFSLLPIHQLLLKLLNPNQENLPHTLSFSSLVVNLAPKYCEILKKDLNFDLLRECTHLCFYNEPITSIISLKQNFNYLCPYDQKLVETTLLCQRMLTRQKLQKDTAFLILCYAVLGKETTRFYLNIEVIAVALSQKVLELKLPFSSYNTL